MMREFFAAADKSLLFALTFCAVYAAAQTIEVWRLRWRMRYMRSVYCEKCKCQLLRRCPTCHPTPEELNRGVSPYRSPDQPEKLPPLPKPGPGRPRIG
jgi:hypothetical protein